MKYCEVGQHEVHALWRSKRVDKNTGEVLQKSCCKDCMRREPIKTATRTKKESKELKVFFADAAISFPDRCENCGAKLQKGDLRTRKAQTCHILPKTKNGGFPTVAAHPSNKVFMCCFGGCYGHGNWDNQDSAKRKTMPVYKIALDRFRKFENLLTESEKIKAYKYLGL